VARDAAAAPDGRWALVGGSGPPGALDQFAAAWHSPDGRVWTAAPVPAEPGFQELQRVTRHGGELVAVGRRGEVFGAWRGDGTSWRAVGRFGDAAGPLPQARSVTAAGATVLAAVDTGLWSSADGGATWRAVTAPAAALALAGRPGTVLMAAQDGTLYRARL
jgi:hypothetical protein